METEVVDIVMRLVAAGVLGACIGFERRIHHKARLLRASAIATERRRR